MPNYFLISLANRTNLDLCIKYALAGFTNSANGFWTYLEIDEGDYISFLYGARVWNLYRVKKKAAFRDAHEIPPWPSITFRTSGKTYYFPFRLFLEPIRSLQESLVRPEFAYVAENLLLRGGYGKTHFQADQTTLQAVSQMGTLYSDGVETISNGFITFVPYVTFTRANANPPDVYPMSELVLQALIKKYLKSPKGLETLLSTVDLLSLRDQQLEVLGERALAEGHVDVIVKEATPIGTSSMIAIEVKMGAAQTSHVDQLRQYVDSIGGEGRGGVLIASKVSPKVISYAKEKGLEILLYRLDVESKEPSFDFQTLSTAFHLISN